MEESRLPAESGHLINTEVSVDSFLLNRKNKHEDKTSDGIERNWCYILLLVFFTDEKRSQFFNPQSLPLPGAVLALTDHWWREYFSQMFASSSSLCFQHPSNSSPWIRFWRTHPDTKTWTKGTSGVRASENKGCMLGSFSVSDGFYRQNMTVWLHKAKSLRYQYKPESLLYLQRQKLGLFW